MVLYLQKRKNNMITAFILNLVYLFLSGIISLLPAISLPSGITDSISYIRGIVPVMDYLIPVNTIFVVLSFVSIFWGLYFSIMLSFFIYDKIRGI